VNELPNRWHSTDDEIAEVADRFDYVLISKDADFKNSFFLRNTPKKILKISLGNLSNDQLIQTVANLVPLIRSLDQRERFLMEVDASGRAVVV
jgi:predicted nuclease of predicted toxin-antitoxin system